VVPQGLQKNYNLISLTHSWSGALLEKLSTVQLLENFPAFYRTLRFITVDDLKAPSCAINK
jgi:hypothetical protein